MIKFSNQVPSIYTSASRDFQYISWLNDIVLNCVKHNVDDIYDLPNNKTDSKIVELLAMTLGFKVKRNYDQKQLYALVAALPRILKYKGTETAIHMAGNALIAASGATGEFKSESVSAGEIRVTFPVDLVDISLFTDLLDYILPAGMTCHIVRENRLDRTRTTEFKYEDILYAEWIPDLDWDDKTRTAIGLSNLFEVNTAHTEELVFTNYKVNKDGELDTKLPNIGLLNNSIIPTMFNSVRLLDQTQQAYAIEKNAYGTTAII